MQKLKLLQRYAALAMLNADTLLLNIKLPGINLSVGILWEYYTLSLAFECL